MEALARHRQEVSFLALTRPALTFGVPTQALVLNVGICFVAGMICSSHSWKNSPFMYWLLALPIHGAMRRLTSSDFHWARTLLLWLMTTGVGITALDIVATQRARRGKDVASSG